MALTEAAGPLWASWMTWACLQHRCPTPEKHKVAYPAIPPLPVCFFFRLFMIHLFCCFCVLQPFCLRLAGFHFVEATAGWSVGLMEKIQQLTLCLSGLANCPQRRSARPGAWALSCPLGCSAVNSTPDFKSNSLDTVSSAMCFEETCLASVAVSLPLSPLLKYTVPAVGWETYGSKWKSERKQARATLSSLLLGRLKDSDLDNQTWRELE